MFRVGTAGVERALEAFGAGRPEVVTDLVSNFDDGVGIADEAEVGLLSSSGISGNGFLVLTTGSAGRGPEGGASGEVDGRRSPVVGAMVTVADVDMGLCHKGKRLAAAIRAPTNSNSAMRARSGRS